MARSLSSQCREYETARRRLTTTLTALALTATCLHPAFGANILKKESSDTVARLIEESGQARSDGDLRLATALLRDAIQIDPENSQARWQVGDIKVGSEWVNVEAAQSGAAADPQQAAYRARRLSMEESPDAELELARWCRRNKLEDEARVHWTRVLSADPSNREALRAVNLRWQNGELAGPGDRRTARQEEAAAAQSLRRWSATVAVWNRGLSDRYGSPPPKIIHEIESVSDVAAIPPVEKITLRPNPPAADKNPAQARLSTAFVRALRDMPQVEATNSLMRHAVMSPIDEVRSSATRELGYRPLTDFVPTLLENLAAPIKTSFRVDVGVGGTVTYRQNIYQEGPLADRSYSTTRSIVPATSPLGMLANQSMSDALPQPAVVSDVREPVRTVSNAGAQRSARDYQNEISDNQRRVYAANEVADAMNERIVAVLANVTGESFGNNPRQWWDWWQDYTDYDRSRERPIYEAREESGVYVRPERPASECFVRGTPVWTKTGRRPIESLSVGDLVLSQNVNSGEIAYKPVLFRTLRQAGPVVQITTSAETFRSTRGHPLWIDGAGWRMARELEVESNLHALRGECRVRSVEPGNNAETYNLVVADFNTYFIGNSGILAHDNTPRRPTRCLVPGLTEKQ